jgi:hypothetical protein
MKNFNHLISSIESINSQLKSYAANAINQSLTIRNWLIGYYIVEFEQNGNDRAEYGEKLFEKLASNLKHIKGIDKRSLFRFRQFYIIYPQLSEVINTKLSDYFIAQEKVGSLTPVLLESPNVGSLPPHF